MQIRLNCRNEIGRGSLLYFLCTDKLALIRLRLREPMRRDPRMGAGSAGCMKNYIWGNRKPIRLRSVTGLDGRLPPLPSKASPAWLVTLGPAWASSFHCDFGRPLCSCFGGLCHPSVFTVVHGHLASCFRSHAGWWSCN